MTILAFSNLNTILFHIFNAEKLLIHNKEKNYPKINKNNASLSFSFKLGFHFVLSAGQ